MKLLLFFLCIPFWGNAQDDLLEFKVEATLNKYKNFVNIFFLEIGKDQKDKTYKRDRFNIFYGSPDLVDDLFHKTKDHISIEDYFSIARRLKNFQTDINLIEGSVTEVNIPNSQINLRASVQKNVPKTNFISKENEVSETEYRNYVFGFVATKNINGTIKDLRIASVYHFEDDDNDQVINFFDECPNSDLNSKTDKNGCEVIVKSLPIPEKKDNIQFSKMLSIPKGKIKVGRRFHPIAGFYMSNYEVTFDEFDEYCLETDIEFPYDYDWGRGKRPVINVSWYDAIKYCNWRSKKEGFDTCYQISPSEIVTNFKRNGYRLPTEEEWELAANKNDFTKKTLDLIGWYAKHSTQRSMIVGQKEPDTGGLFDLFGNVGEWTNDWYSDEYHVGLDDKNPDRNKKKIIRGGNFSSMSNTCNSTYRFNVLDPKIGNQFTGFRIVRSGETTIKR